ncbi:MAG: hypothetical protein EOP11_01320 [Proteobacteria bacterium]|nr:MAG: hypothetical protein EOP11_01320 [Pseudomonadota bacterium]
MGKQNFSWAFSLPAAFSLVLLFSGEARAVDPSATVSGGPTFVPTASQGSSAVTSRAASQGVALPGSPTNIGTIPTPDTIPAPSTTTSTAISLGQYVTANKEVKIEKMLLDRYQQSVVSIRALDLAGNELSRAMGVGVGANAQFIAAPLSLLLGNEQQWADRIEISHVAGNRYTAKVALIDEEKNIVLLAPEASPAAMTFVREQNERPQITVFMISFEQRGNAMIPRSHRGMLAAVNRETGLFSVSSGDLTDSDAGTAVIASTGELVGMLLPNNRGVLASTLQRLIEKAKVATPIEPNRIGAILGRGVIVGGTDIPGSYPTIMAALEAIKKGEAPKADATLFTPARSRAVAPKEADKVVIRVMPGTYKEGKTITLPSNLSLAGSGPDRTILRGSDPEKPVVLVQGEENNLVAGFRIIPAPKQSMKAPTVILSKARNTTLLGNVIETKGGVAVWATQSTNVRLNGNAFPENSTRAISCERSTITLDANAFIGAWPMAIAADRGCNASINRSLFYNNDTGINVAADAGRISVRKNTFIRGGTGVKVAGKVASIEGGDNIFFETSNGISSIADIPGRSLGRNAVWKSRLTVQGKNAGGVDLVRSQPRFQGAESYDFRLVPGQSQLSTADMESGVELGAFQFSEYMGPYTQQVVRAMSVAVGQPSLPALWGVSP